MIVASPESVPYYYGPITRENAELVLFDRGCIDGMYLLRTSQSKNVDFVLSLCYDRRVIHYRIIKDVDDLYYISGMESNKYAGPIELIQNIPEFVSFLNIPCLKPLNVFMPGVNCSVPEDKLKEALKKKADEWGIQESEFGPMMDDERSEVWRLVLKTLHECESWYHGRISREEAESRLAHNGFENGNFLVRERDDCSFTLSLCHESQIKHYKIDVLSTGEVGIQDGPRFDNIISLVSHYSVFNDGLWCQLHRPCAVNNEDTTATTLNVSQMKRSDSTSDILHEVNSKEGKSLYPCLAREDLLESNQSLSKSVVPKDDIISRNKCSNKKSASIWFINHMPKLSRDKSDVDSGMQPSPHKAKVSKPPKGKPRRLTPLDISAPVIARKAPLPPVSPEVNCVSPTSPVVHTTDTDSHPDSSLVNKMSCATLNEYTAAMKVCAKQPLSSPNVVQNEFPVVTNVTASFSSKVRDSLTPSNCVKPEEGISVPKKPLPVPRQRKSSALKAEKLTSHIVLPSEPSPLLSRTPCTPPSQNVGRMSELVFTYPFPNELPVKGESLLCDDTVECDPVKPFPWMVDIAKTQMPNVIAELKERSNRNLAVSEGRSEAATDEMKPCGTPQYEEIDPQFEKSDMPDLSLVISKEAGDGDSSNGAVESLLNLDVENSNWDATKDESSITARPFQRKPSWTKEESELHFKTIRRYRKGPTAIDRKNLIFQEKLGLGNFGDVVKAVFKLGEVEVPCAVKTLRQESIASGKEDISKEARIMTKMDHPHIVRLLGVCEGDPFLLVMELAPLGPLNFYVKRNQDVSPRDILLLLYQVACGMEYLESKQFVHRDLAARNVLLVNESFAKISDFGMSRAIGLHSDYYRVEPQAKLPLKWYAPECIYYFRFSCKSDVWSYGVTLWEALSYGEKPYQGLSGREILAMFGTNRRLVRPENCSDEIYRILLKCWQFRPEDRPTFSELTATLKAYLNV